jgi:hypothetical protein
MFCGGGTFSKWYPFSPPWYPYFAEKPDTRHSADDKCDGYTGPFTFKTGKGVRLVSRNRKSFNHDYRRLIIIDGEIVALDAQEGPPCSSSKDTQKTHKKEPETR